MKTKRNINIWVFRASIFLYSIFLLFGIADLAHASIIDSSVYLGDLEIKELTQDSGGHMLFAGILFFIAMLSIYPKIKSKWFICLVIFTLVSLIICVINISSLYSVGVITPITWICILIFTIFQYLTLRKIQKSGIISINCSKWINISLILGILTFIVSFMIAATIIGLLIVKYVYAALIDLWAVYNLILLFIIAISTKSE